MRSARVCWGADFIAAVMVFSVSWRDALEHLSITVHRENLISPDEDRFKQ